MFMKQNTEYNLIIWVFRVTLVDANCVIMPVGIGLFAHNTKKLLAD